MKSIPFTCFFNSWDGCSLLTSLRGEHPNYCHLLFSSLPSPRRTMLTCLDLQVKALPTSLIPATAPLPRNNPLYSPHNPMAISLSEFKSLRFKPQKKKKKKTLLVPGSSLSPPTATAVRQRRGRSPVSSPETREHFQASVPNPGRHQRPTLMAAAQTGGDKTKPLQEPQVSLRPDRRRGSENPGNGTTELGPSGAPN